MEELSNIQKSVTYNCPKEKWDGRGWAVWCRRASRWCSAPRALQCPHRTHRIFLKKTGQKPRQRRCKPVALREVDILGV